MTICSSPGEGTVVELWLPVSRFTADADSERPVTLAQRGALGTALLVDDEDLVRMSTADMLLDLGYEVIEARSAEEAIANVGEGLHPDLLVTDHLMPGMNGVELAHLLRTQIPGLPVLIVSGYAEGEGITSDLTRLAKPFRTSELAESLSAIRNVGSPDR
jgi:CheY-like chemotaxis protein